MPAYDFLRETKFTRFVNTTTLTSGSNGATIDTRGFNSVVFFLSFGVLAGTLELFIQGSHDASVWTDIPAAEILGRRAGLTADGHIVGGTTTGGALRFGVLSKFRYYRVRMGGAGATYLIGGGAILSEPTDSPTAVQYR